MNCIIFFPERGTKNIRAFVTEDPQFPQHALVEAQDLTNVHENGHVLFDCHDFVLLAQLFGLHQKVLEQINHFPQGVVHVELFRSDEQVCRLRSIHF
jgi:hypothetical protein